ncbi:hypothetical protein FA11_4728 [Pelosinus fermentans A11]|nr:hypothetical protein FA11_4728 [Pelosinus fermentans A11]
MQIDKLKAPTGLSFYISIIQFNVYAKVKMRLSGISITASTHVETIILMKNCGSHKN